MTIATSNTPIDVLEPEELIDRANVPDPASDPIGVGYLGEPA